MEVYLKVLRRLPNSKSVQYEELLHIKLMGCRDYMVNNQTISIATDEEGDIAFHNLLEELPEEEVPRTHFAEAKYIHPHYLPNVAHKAEKSLGKYIQIESTFPEFTVFRFTPYFLLLMDQNLATLQFTD